MNADELKAEGLHLFQQGDKDRALEKFETAVARYREENNPQGEAEMLNNIGVVQRVRGRNQEAITAFNQADALFTQLGDVGQRGQVLANLGDLYTFTRQRQEAFRCYSDASALLASAGDRARQSQVLRALSLLRLRQMKWLEGMLFMEQSLAIAPQRTLGQKLLYGLLRFVTRLMGGNQ